VSAAVILDESIVGPEDVDARHDQGHGINIKLMSAAGSRRRCA
jgi:hypothetical protein